MFVHVGDSASSRSAMNTRAPLLSALMSILRSAGPVDLDPPIAQVDRGVGHAPVGGPHVLRIGQELERAARHEPRPAISAPRQQLPPPRAELALQLRHERPRVRVQDMCRVRLDGRTDLDACHPFPPVSSRMKGTRGDRTAAGRHPEDHSKRAVRAGRSPAPWVIRRTSRLLRLRKPRSLPGIGRAHKGKALSGPAQVSSRG